VPPAGDPTDFSDILVIENPPLPNFPNPAPGSDQDTNDYKAIRYWWVNRPQEVQTDQVRAEFTYTLRTPGLFDAQDRHDFLAGTHYIRDEIDFYRGTESVGQALNQDNVIGQNLPINEDGDAFFIRSFFDFSDFRYNGEPLAQPGGDFLTSNLWYRGYYGVYHGRFLTEKLGVILVYRRDSFQAEEILWAREQFDPTNQLIGIEQQSKNFDENVVVESATYALNYKITDDLSVYGLIAQGVSPNTGQQDGSGNFFEPEQTESEEIGLKFELLEGRISGTVSAFRIRRENATYFWANAPNPRSWGDHDGEFANTANFRPDLIEDGTMRQGYAIDISYFDVEKDLGWTNGRRPRGRWWENVPGVLGEVRNAFSGGEGEAQDMIVLDYAMLDETGFRAQMDQAFADAATRSQPDDITPIFYQGRVTVGDGSQRFLNASAFPGATVSFTDEATGFDLQVIFQPTDNWQIVTSFAHVQREAISSFFLSDGRALSSGLPYGTEYDIWVLQLGQDNFEDPTDPSTATGGGVAGLNLSFQPENSGSIWSNYKFDEGFLEGFEIGAGLIYVGSAQTSVPIGGNNLAANLYGTPDTEEIYEVNGALTYKRRFDKFDLRLSLNFYNLFDKTYYESRITYENVVTGESEKRRTFFYRDPRSFRLTATLSF